MAPDAVCRRAWKFRLSLAAAEAVAGCRNVRRLAPVPARKLAPVLVPALVPALCTRVKENRGRMSRTRASVVEIKAERSTDTEIPQVLERTGVHGSMAGVRFGLNIWFV